jgi:spore germination cell wall hydrolase CwlJ-like protein
MVWKLRLFWYGLDKVALAVALVLGAVVGALAIAASAVFVQRDAKAAAVRDFDARSIECLALNVYYEARGESLAGQYAVAEVTMNRKSALGFPKTLCDVVYQKGAFSWTDEKVDQPGGAEWRRAIRVAEDTYYRRRAPALPGALYYHATYTRPAWAKERERVARIGAHIFYR